MKINFRQHFMSFVEQIFKKYSCNILVNSFFFFFSTVYSSVAFSWECDQTHYFHINSIKDRQWNKKQESFSEIIFIDIQCSFTNYLYSTFWILKSYKMNTCTYMQLKNVNFRKWEKQRKDNLFHNRIKKNEYKTLSLTKQYKKEW